jgi:predicted transcriptional regulator
MTYPEILLRELQEGPGTSSELACCTGLPQHVITAVLQRMILQGRVARTTKPVDLADEGKATYIYALIEHRSALAI